MVELLGSEARNCVSRTMIWGEEHSLSIDVGSFEQLHEFASCCTALGLRWVSVEARIKLLVQGKVTFIQTLVA